MGALKAGYLLDTHALLWAVQEDRKLGREARRVIENIDTELYASAISAFEVANKHRLGKLPGYDLVAENFPAIVRRLGARELPVSMEHAWVAAKLAWPHRDPFDRVLAAQASVEGLTLITNDAAFASLPWLAVLW